MTQLRQPEGAPVYKDGGSTHHTYVYPNDALGRDEGFYLFPVTKKYQRHAHKYIEMGLVDHVVCYDCGLCKERKLIPFFNSTL